MDAVWTHCQSRHSGEGKNILFVPKTKPHCLGCPAHNAVTILITVIGNWKKRKEKRRGENKIK
jgi:hypothetical protein